MKHDTIALLVLNLTADKGYESGANRFLHRTDEEATLLILVALLLTEILAK